MLNYYKNPQVTQVLKHLIENSGIPLKEVERDFTIDSSGWSTTLYGRWFNARSGKWSKRKLFKKAHVTSGVVTNIITAVDISEGYHNDSPYFEGLIKTTAKNYLVREVSADAGYCSRKNMSTVSELGAIPYIMFRRTDTGKPKGHLIWKRMHKMYKNHTTEFKEHYHKRSNAESVFNMIKRKMGTNLRCKSELGQVNELLCKCLAHNICVLINELYEANTVLDYENCEKLICRY